MEPQTRGNQHPVDLRVPLANGRVEAGLVVLVILLAVGSAFMGWVVRIMPFPDDLLPGVLCLLLAAGTLAFLVLAISPNRGSLEATMDEVSIPSGFLRRGRRSFAFKEVETLKVVDEGPLAGLHIGNSRNFWVVSADRFPSSAPVLEVGLRLFVRLHLAHGAKRCSPDKVRRIESRCLEAVTSKNSTLTWVDLEGGTHALVLVAADGTAEPLGAAETKRRFSKAVLDTSARHPF